MSNFIHKETKRYQAMIIPADTIDGVHIPFVSFSPTGDYKGDPVLMFNDDQSDDLNESAVTMMNSLFHLAHLLVVFGPVIMPILPSKKAFLDSLAEDGIEMEMGDSKTLCRECFSKLVPPHNPFYRLDQQISRIMVSVCVNRSFICFGHGRSGIAAMRYALIEPTGVKRVVVGATEGYIPIVSGKDAYAFDYPLGVRDMDVLFGKRHDRHAYSHIDYDFYIGDQDLQHDFKENTDFCPADIQCKYEGVYGTGMKQRITGVMSQYEKALLNVYMRVYNGDSRTMITKSDFRDVVYRNVPFEEFPSKRISQMP